MGIYLNPNNENFTRTTKREIYVDKTMMIAVLNRFMDMDNTYVCVSRPRRFGKTIAGNMLSSYYSKGCDSRTLFAPFKISGDPGFASNLNKLNVIKIDMNSEYQNARNKDRLLDDLQDKIVAEFAGQFPDIAFDTNDSVGNCILKAYAQKGEKFVVIIDEYAVTNKIIQASKDLLAETLRLNADAVAKSLDESHIHVTSNRSYNNEDALQSAIYLSYIYALNKYTIVKEMTSGKGFADVVFIPFVPDHPAMIIELKRNGSPESAITQIREKRYFDSLSAYSGDLLFVGVNYDEDTKTHECKIEKFTK